MTDQAHAPAAANPSSDQAAPTDAEQRAKLAEKLQLLTECLVMAARVKALEEAIEDKRGRLQQLMTEGGDKTLTCPLGQAAFGNTTTFTVADPTKLAALFSPEVLAQHVAVTKAFWEGAEKAGVAIASVVTRHFPPVFKIEGGRSADTREQRNTFIEHTKQAASDKATEVAKAILNSPQKGN